MEVEEFCGLGGLTYQTKKAEQQHSWLQKGREYSEHTTDNDVESLFLSFLLLLVCRREDRRVGRVEGGGRESQRGRV